MRIFENINTIVLMALLPLFVSCSGERVPAPESPETTTMQTAKRGSHPITAKWTKIVRGVNGGKCDATAIGDGNNPKVGPKEDLTNLSVSCSDDKKVSLKTLSAPLPSANICWSELEYLRKARREVLVVSDPTPDNPYHCLLSTITPKQFVSKAYWKPKP